mgnify:CR=1 FL=1
MAGLSSSLLTRNSNVVHPHNGAEQYRDGSADVCAHGLSSVVDMPTRSAKRNTDGANARQAYERADENPLVWRPSVKRLPEVKLTKPAIGWLVPTSDDARMRRDRPV